MKSNKYGAYDYAKDAMEDEEFDVYATPENTVEDTADYDIANEEELDTESEEDESFFVNFNDALRHDPLVIECSAKTKEEKREVFIEILNVLKNPSTSIKQKDDAKYKAICYLYALIRKLIRQYASTFVTRDNYDDYLQTGYMAVCQHLLDYNPEKCVPSTFFYDHIKHEIVKKVGSERGCSRYYNEKLTLINRVISSYTSQGKSFSETDIAIATGEPILTVRRVMNAINSQNQASLEEAEYHVSDRDSDNPEKKAIDADRRRIVMLALKSIILEEGKGKPNYIPNEIGYEVMLMKYGFYSGKEMSQKEIAVEMTKLHKDRWFSIDENGNKVFKDMPIDEVRKHINRGHKRLKNCPIPAEAILGRKPTSVEIATRSRKLSQIFPEYNFDDEVKAKENFARNISYNSDKANKKAIEELIEIGDEEF